MAIGVYFSPAVLTAEQYDESIKRLRKAGAGHPPGRLYHASFGGPEKVSVFDVWTSQAAFDKFGKTLMPMAKELGVDLGTPQIVPIHNVIARPKAAPAKKKRARANPAARRAGKKKKR